MMNIRKVSLPELLAPAGVFKSAHFLTASVPVATLYADISGFHIYNRLGLNLRLSAAEDDKSATRYLRTLEAYTRIIDEAAKAWGVTILEVQGEVMHCLLPSDTPNPTSIRRVIGFCSSVTQAVYEVIPKIAGQAFDGFKSAADHGRSIVIGLSDNMSVVSLGPCANAPAKQLPNVTAAHLSMRREHLEVVGRTGERSNWVEVNVLTPSEQTSGWFNSEPAYAQIRTFCAQHLWEFKEASERSIAFGLRSFNFSTSSAPARFQGFFFRADQDGFSKQVETAFAAGQDQEKKIQQLVEGFRETVQRSLAFNQATSWPCIWLPWAGDCANVILLPRDSQTYAAMREKAGVIAPKAWHELWTKMGSNTRWAVGMAGGNGEEGNDGLVLVATMYAAGRSFPIAAGWGVRRSADAYQAYGVRGEDTVIPVVDRMALEKVYQEAFKSLDSRFDRATLLRLQEAEKKKSEQLSPRVISYTPAAATLIPPSRPFSADAMMALYA